jgi:hypothetical protein
MTDLANDVGSCDHPGHGGSGIAGDDQAANRLEQELGR